ncbi:MAG: hypothetical protein AB1603_01755 [Chloroflexota bacterium]
MNNFDIASQVSHIEANRTVKDTLMQALRVRSSKKRISVTDLLSLKQAFFRRKYPEITPTLERQQLMWSGTGFHELFGAAVSSEEYREQFVEYEGVVGKIDIFEDMPVEIKTTGRLADEMDLPRKRPSYIEQLGMYCGMVGVKEGRIVIYQRDAGLTGQAPLSVCHLRFSDLDAVRSEMRRRRELLEAALASDNASALPVCSWGDWGCDYSGVCDCKTSKVAASHAILERMELLEADEAAAREFMDKLAQPRPVGAALRLNDIVFPRKTYFARLRREAPLDEEAQEQEAREQLSSMGKWGVVSAVRDSLRYGSPGGSQRVPVSEGTLSDMVTLHQGQPAIVRNTALRSIVERERLPSMSPHFFLRLGFECALTGQARGRLVLYYSNVPREDAKLLVYDVSFKGIETLKAEASRRVRLLETAKGPEELPPCPAWMARYCKYSPACGCG